VWRAPPHQRDGAGADERPLVEALAALYSDVYYGRTETSAFTMSDHLRALAQWTLWRIGLGVSKWSALPAQAAG
jgi:hypothetical protein